MVVEAVVVGIDGTAPEAPGWVTITYQLSKTEHTTRDGKLEMARLENEAALGVNLAYPGAFRARLRAALGGAVIEATPPGIDGVFNDLSDGEYILEVEKDPDASFTPHVNDAVARRIDVLSWLLPCFARRGSLRPAGEAAVAASANLLKWFSQLPPSGAADLRLVFLLVSYR